MKTKNGKTRWIILTFVFVMIATGIFAQRGNDRRKVLKTDQEQLMPPPPAPPALPPHQGVDPNEGTPPPAFSLPDLTDDQRAKMKKTNLKQMEVMTPLRNQMREKKARLATILATPPVNTRDAETIADEIGNLEASILKQQIRHDQELRNLLTPDQQILFDARPKPFLNKGKQGRGR